MLISVVTPVFNGARFLHNTYQCLLKQTYSHWEWVVVNDGSTDDTRTIVTSLAANDQRIKYYEQKNCGSAKQPRDHAVYESNGELILPLDVDDSISPDYLATMLDRMKATDADIVYPKMQFIDLATNTITQILPTKDIDTDQTYTGRDLIKHTLPEWSIGCNGGLYRKNIWVNMSYPVKEKLVWMNSDEVDERLYLLQAKRVAFATAAEYRYQNHQESITIHISPKLFHPLKTCIELKELMEKEFGMCSEEYRRANRKVFYTWRTLTALYAKKYRNLDNADSSIMSSLRTCFMHIDAPLLTKKERLQFLGFKSYALLFTLFCLKYNPSCFLVLLIRRFMPTAYRWYFIRRRSEHNTKRQIASSYAEAKEKDAYKAATISMFCGNAQSGGLVDRLRGIVSTYMTCKKLQRPFCILFTHPFSLSDYLQPACYDWTISMDEITFSPRQTAVTICDTQIDNHWERSQQEKLFHKEISKYQKKQHHIYTNASFCYDKDFAKAFHELFRPTPRLQQHLDAIYQEIGENYITISTRFCNLLDDFNEEIYNEPLPKEAQEKLLTACMHQIQQLHNQHPTCRVVICSDSTTLLHRAECLDYVYIIPGTVSHIGNDLEQSYDYYEKTFLDFFVIAHANHVYLLRGPRMMQSGFPYAAALIGGNECQVIEFKD